MSHLNRFSNFLHRCNVKFAISPT